MERSSVQRFVGLYVAWLWLLTAGLGSQASAQSCHAAPPPSQSHAAFSASLTSQFATYRNASFEGEYQGLGLAGFARHGAVQLAAGLMGYRLVSNGLTAYGLGDLSTQAGVTVHSSEAGSLSTGPDLAVTAPTGDAAKRLGMGHFMLMPGWSVRYGAHGFSAFARVGYGIAVGPSLGGGHRHGGTGPIVQPMNRSEVEHSLQLTYVHHELLTVLLRVAGAVPVATDDGAVRESLAGGVGLRAGRVDVSAEVALPLAGNPFLLRSALTVALVW